MKNCLPILMLLFALNLFAQEDKDIIAVKNLLENQRQAWNQGNIEAFMEGYWKSEQLQFIGQNGVTYGWDNTLKRYKKGYPDKAAMGQLTFDIINVDKRSKKVISMLGKFTLKRDNDEPSGYFLLIFQKIKKKWVIVADHTS